MDLQEYNKLKKQADEEYHEAASLAMDELDKRLAAIEVVWQMAAETGEEDESEESQQQDADTPSANGRAGQPGEYGLLTENVKQAINKLNRSFVKWDVKHKIAFDISTNSLDGCLRRLVKQDYIKITRIGRGRAPTRYKRISDGVHTL